MPSVSKSRVLQRLELLKLDPNTELGQHFCISDNVLAQLTEHLTTSDAVVEVGAGVGQLTQLLAEKASYVIAIEVDSRYTPVLRRLEKQYANLEVMIGNALELLPSIFGRYTGKKGVPAKKPGLSCSLPYHITEPFFHLATQLNIQDMRLLVGDRAAQTVCATDPSSPEYSALSFLANAYFTIDHLADVPPSAFLPEPKTQSAIIHCHAKQSQSLGDVLARRLIATQRYSGLVKNVLKEGLIHDACAKHPEQNLTQNQAREQIAKWQIPQRIGEKPFSQLANGEVRTLAQCLRNIR